MELKEAIRLVGEFLSKKNDERDVVDAWRIVRVVLSTRQAPEVADEMEKESLRLRGNGFGIIAATLMSYVRRLRSDTVQEQVYHPTGGCECPTCKAIRGGE